MTDLLDVASQVDLRRLYKLSDLHEVLAVHRPVVLLVGKREGRLRLSADVGAPVARADRLALHTHGQDQRRGQLVAVST